MKFLPTTAAAALMALSSLSSTHAVAPEYKSCHGGNAAACKHWRDRSCLEDANPAACDYEEAHKQKDPLAWCSQRYRDNAAAYRWCVNGSPDR